MLFIVATNIVASRPPEHQPTGTPYSWVNSSLTDVNVQLVTRETDNTGNWQHMQMATLATGRVAKTCGSS